MTQVLALFCPVLYLFDAFSNVYKLLVLSGVLMCERCRGSVSNGRHTVGETNNKRSLTKHEMCYCCVTALFHHQETIKPFLTDL